MDSTTLNNLLLFTVTALGAGITALWLGMTMWTWQDMRARSRDPLAQIAATLLVFALPPFGIMVYLMLRPRETLADAYERSLEEEALLQDIEEKPACPGCGRPTRDDWQVCPHCHTRLKKLCVSCGSRLELTWNLCPVCATPQVSYDESERLDAQSAVPTGRPDNQKRTTRSVMRQISDDQSPYEYRAAESSDLEFVDE